MIRNELRDFDDKTLKKLLDEEEEKEVKIRIRLNKLREDFIFYLITFVLMGFVCFIPKYTILALFVATIVCYVVPDLNRKYFFQVGTILMFAGIYFGIYALIKAFNLFIPTLYVLIVVFPYFVLLVAFICFIIAAFKCLLNSSAAGMSRFCDYIGVYNLHSLKMTNEIRICRLKTEMKYREENRILEEKPEELK